MVDNGTNSNQFSTDDPNDPTAIEQSKRDEQLSQDFDTPFSPPSGVQDRLTDTHPVTDTNVDPHERYDAGIEAASGADLPGQAADEKPTDPESAEHAQP